MMINDFLLREMEIAASGVVTGDELSLARFRRECTPERVLAILEDFNNSDNIKDDLYNAQEELEEAEEEISDLKDNVYHLELKLEKEIDLNSELQTEIYNLKREIESKEV